MKISEQRHQLNNRNSRRGAIKLRLFTVIALAGVGALVYFGLFADNNASNEARAMENNARYHRVERGALTVSLLAPGTTKAKNTTTIQCQIQDGNIKIVWLIDEGTIVQEGEKLAELEVDGLDAEIVDQKVEVETEYAEYQSAQQDLEIQQSQNESDLLAAENKLALARLDLNKYLEGDYPQAVRNAEAEISLAESELKRAQDRVRWTERLVEEGFVSAGELEADQISLKRSTINLEKAQEELKLLKEYEYERQISQLQTAYKESQMQLERTKLDAERQLRNRQIRVDSNKSRYDLEVVQLRQMEDQMANTVILAPQNGMVVYYRDGGRRGNEEIVEAGANVRFRQRMFELPDFSSWIMETRVHESMIRRVERGQPSLITIDALPGQTLTGYVNRVGVLPEQGNWFSPDVKEYKVEIALTTTTLPLKPGMSAKVELILNDLKDVLKVPVQSVLTVDGTPVVWRRGETGDVATAIEIGEYNDNFLQVVSGLREGDMVLLNPPLDAPVPKSVMQRPSQDMDVLPESRTILETSVTPADDDAGQRAERGERDERGERHERTATIRSGEDGPVSRGPRPQQGDS